jgi:hypothetical protein
MNANLRDALTPCPACKREIALALDRCPHCQAAADSSSPFVPFRYPNGGRGAADQLTCATLRSKRPAATPADLESLLSRTTRVRISEFVLRESRYEPEPVIEISEPAALSTFRGVLRMADAEVGHLMTFEDRRIECFSEGGRLAAVGLIRASVLRCPERWSTDGLVADPDALADFLAACGYPALRRMLDDERAASARREEEFARWRTSWSATTPTGLAPLAEGLAKKRLTGSSPEVEEARRILASAYSGPEGQVLALLAWYGHSAGPWSPYYCVEDAPKALLETFDVAVVVAAANAADLSPRQLEGAARFFCRWRERGKPPADPIPASLRIRLGAYLESTGSEDKLRRFRAVYPE